MKSFVQKPQEVQRNWRLFDAKGKVLGRLASDVAVVLRGKDKPSFTPHVDGGDFVVVINAEQVQLTGNKWQDKVYHRHTGYVGGLKSETAEDVRGTHPERLVEDAVKGMLPKGPLGRKLFGKLKVYAGAEHPHEAQKPTPVAS